MAKLQWVVITCVGSVGLAAVIVGGLNLLTDVDGWRAGFARILVQKEGEHLVIRPLVFWPLLILLFGAFTSLVAVRVPALRKHLNLESFVVPGEIVPPGSNYVAIQQRFVDKVAETKKAAHKRVEVYGFTFTAFWPLLRTEVLENDDVRGWTFEIYYISPALVRARPELFQSQWLKDVTAQEANMRDWLERSENKTRLANRGVNIILRAHTVVPFVHGKVWGDGSVFVHIAHWGTPSDGIEYPRSFHLVFEGNDRRGAAKSFASLMENWGRKYKHNWDLELHPNPVDRRS
ncbi:MAG: hypothetical protein AAFR11_04675 [Pseudomonadota bacterium]